MINFSKNQKEIIKVFQVGNFLKACIAFNIFYALLMLTNDVVYLFLVYFLLAGVLLYSFVFIKLNNFNYCVFSVFFSSFCFSFFSILFLGWGYGFEYYIIPIITYCYVGVYSKRHTMYLIGLFGLIYFLLMYYFFAINDYSLKITLYYFDDSNKFCFNVFNATFLASLFVFISNILRKQIRDELKTRQIQNMQLDITASFDDLTGLLNRWAFIDMVDDLKVSNNINIALIDIDFFKQVNDTYGHGVGDKVLKTCSNLIKKYFSPHSKILVRWGGEEFLILTSGLSLDEFYEICEAFRKEYEGYDFEIPNLNSTVSIGVIYMRENFTASILDDCFNKVDKCLYEAKNSGRNKTIKKII